MQFPNQNDLLQAAILPVSAQLSQLKQVLSDYAMKAGGTAVVVSNLQMLWEQSSMANDRPRILICWNGENRRGDFSVASVNHRVDRKFIVAVTRGKGWGSERGASVYKTVGDADPFADVVSEVRDLIRCMVGISGEFPIDYVGTSPMTSGNKSLDSYGIEFTTANDNPEILMTNPNAPTSP